MTPEQRARIEADDYTIDAHHVKVVVYIDGEKQYVSIRDCIGALLARVKTLMADLAGCAAHNREWCDRFNTAHDMVTTLARRAEQAETALAAVTAEREHFRECYKLEVLKVQLEFAPALEQQRERAEQAETALAAMTALAYVGDHHFPDLTYKARLEELVPQHRALEARVQQLEVALREFGVHPQGGPNTPTCGIYLPLKQYTCDCGLDAALAGLAEPPRGSNGPLRRG